MTESDWKQDPEYLELRAEFMGSFLERVRMLEGALGAGKREELQHVAHKLAGTAGSYGFPEIGELASRIDDALDQKACPEVEAWARELIEALKGAAKR